MASFASKVSGTQMVEFFNRFGRYGGDMELLKVLLADDERMRTWMDLIPDKYITVFVSYVRPPYEELNGRKFDRAEEMFKPFKEWYVSGWIRDAEDHMPGNRVFFMKTFDRDVTSNEVSAWAAANGYREAILEEALDFAESRPDIQRALSIVILGSLSICGVPHVAVLKGNSSERTLETCGYHRKHEAGCGFLLVRKAA